MTGCLRGERKKVSARDSAEGDTFMAVGGGGWPSFPYWPSRCGSARPRGESYDYYRSQKSWHHVYTKATMTCLTGCGAGEQVLQQVGRRPQAFEAISASCRQSARQSEMLALSHRARGHAMCA